MPARCRTLAVRATLARILPLLLAASCATCTTTPRDARVSPRIAVMLPPSERPFWRPIADAFERAHAGVRVDLVEGPQATDLRENLYTASLLAGDPSFDLVYMDVTWTSKFASAGWLVPLDDEFTGDARAAFLPAALEAGHYRGQLFRIPVRTDVGLLYYRADWLRDAGFEPPVTFADLERIARALQHPPARWGFVWQGKQYEGLVCAFLEVLRGHGGFWIDADSRAVGLDRPEALAALEFLTRCRSEGGISPLGVATYQEEESRRIFADGHAVFLRNWPYVWRLAQRDDSPVRGRVGAIAMVHAPGGHSAGTLGGWGLGISTTSRQRALALAFVRHATSLESQRMLCAPTGYAPARRAAYADSVLLAANPFLREIERLHADAVARPAVAHYARASDILQRHLSAALAGTSTPPEALREAARETRALLGAPTLAEVR
jgi:multiple sugar transport system substrate-binding protein